MYWYHDYECWSLSVPISMSKFSIILIFCSVMASPTHRVVAIPRPLDAIAPVISPPVAQDFPTLCQICMDAPASVLQLCGVVCLAEVCEPCLVRHLAANVYSFYSGVLPKIRCPVCLNLLNKNQWDNFVLPRKDSQQEEEQQDDNSHVLDKYMVLCRQSCGFQSPCCHNAEYTMLPDRYAESEDEDDENAQMTLTLVQVEALPELHQRGVEFCYHREDAAEFYEFLTEKFQEKVDALLWRLLPKIADEERRAALLLRHLNRNPDTQTRCCGMDVCFKCKATHHHDGNCRDFIEDENVLECRGCGVTVVMVDGCDALRCLCGYSFSWSDEVARQRAQRKRLAPSDDSEYKRWVYWHSKMRESLHKVENMSATQRELCLARLVREHRALLRRVLLPLAPESAVLSRSVSVP